MQPDVGQADGDGPDGSSLRPVSSLRARFENMTKPSDTPTQQQQLPTPQLQIQKPPSRPISPAPKPDKLRDLKLSQDAAPSSPVAHVPTTPTVPSRPKDRPKPAPAPTPVVRQPDAETVIQPPSRPSSTKPLLNPKPQALAATPAVTVQPPQSPPKGKLLSTAAAGQPALLNPDPVPDHTILGTPLKPVNPPTRTGSPAPAPPPPRSPRTSARPPSPPPPRRSAELKRETKVAPPPPAPRRIETLGIQTSSTPKKGDVSEENSPFSSPPSSPGTADDETPPQLPTRPRPQSVQVQSTRPKSVISNFEPPPVHHSVVDRRNARSSETNGSIPRSYAASQPFEDARTGPPRTSHALESMPSRTMSVHQTTSAPPRPPRPNGPTSMQSVDTVASVAPTKRISSNPTTQQLPLPPTRTHGRSKTLDRPSTRAVSESSANASSVSTAVAPRSTQIPASVQSVVPKGEAAHQVTTYPDVSSTNRRPPYAKKATADIQTKYDPRIFDVCGELICTSGQLTRIWNTVDGELLMSLPAPEGVKITAVAFKPAATPQEEGTKIWLGTSSGEIMEVDVLMHSVTHSKASVHGRQEIIRIYRHYNELWTLDELGSLLVWGPDETGVPNVEGHPSQGYKVPKAHTFSMVVGDELWHATGKEIRVFAPTLDGKVQFQVLIRPLSSEGTGEVTSGTLIRSQPGKVFFGHSDGKISIYSTKDYLNVGVLNISTWKMNSIVGVGHRLWVGYNVGKICVYDITEAPWTVLKEWQAHTNPVVSMKANHAGSYRLDRVQLVSLGADNKLKVWDGLLEDDWIEDEMKSRDTTYCDFDEIKALVFTWNAGASTPHSLRYSGNDGVFFPELLKSSGCPDILVFGFQELVDLEDKTATAKRFLKSKKKEGPDQERMSHQYRDWRDFLVKTLDDYMPAGELYQLLHTAPLVGLFTCVFVKASLRERIRNLNGAEVKRGMGGLHGNKGAVAVRFQIDDSTLCFVNCHLAAGQSQAAARHNDIAEILDQEIFRVELDHDVRIDSFAGGGDGSSVLDHELCIINGDLNYRIDTMSRDTVVGAVKQNNLAKLLERDQLLVAKRRNHAFRLRAFEEMPITFPPTYKYDVGTDNYDTSEKRRSPAWCDRLLFRGRGRVQQLDYRRHEVRTSDHRPVTGSFRLWVKKVRPSDRAKALMESQQSFETARQQETADEKLYYLMAICGFDEATSRRLIAEKPSRNATRSSSRTREAY